MAGQQELFGEAIRRSAVFSECRTWRYTLERYWDDDKPRILFILLNPSTADEKRDDPTNRRAIRFVKRWGGGSCIFVNLFAFRTPHPAEMKEAKDPIGPENDFHILAQVRLASQIICGWGAHGRWMDRDLAVMKILIGFDCYTLGQTSGGAPKHPLYLSGETLPTRWIKGRP